MEIPQTIKQEKVDYDSIEQDVKKTNILDTMKIKLEAVKLEPPSYVPEPNNLYLKHNLTEETKMMGSNDKYMFDCSLNKNIGLGVQLEGSEEMKKIKEMQGDVNVKWLIKNEELNIKDEIKIEDMEQGKVSTLVSQQQQSKTRATRDNKKDIDEKNNRCKQHEYRINRMTQKRRCLLERPEKSMPMIKCELCDFQTIYKIRFNRHVKQHNGDNRHISKYKKLDKVNMCGQCDYQTVNRRSLKKHSLIHKKANEIEKYEFAQCELQTVHKDSLIMRNIIHKTSGKVDMYKCDQCEFQTIYKDSLKKRSLKHKTFEEVDMYKCDQCEFQTIYKHSFKKHSLKHKTSNEVDMYKCDQCEFQTIYKGYLKQHSLRHKTSDEVDTFRCDQCEYQTVYKTLLKNHSLKHKHSDEIDMYKCNQCDFQTIHKDGLRKHSLKHKRFEEVDTYKCSHGQCKFQTVYKGNLKKHSLKHKRLDELIRKNVVNVITKPFIKQ